MKKKRKKTVCFMLVSVLLWLTGCSTEKSSTHMMIYEDGKVISCTEAAGSEPMGRYVEKKVALPKEFAPTALYRLSDGRLLVLDEQKNGKIAFSEDDGETWQMKPNKLWRELRRRKLDILSMAVSSDGVTYIAYRNPKAAEQKKSRVGGMAYLDTEGMIYFPKLIFDKRGEYAVKAVCTEDDRLYVLTDANKVYEVDVRGESVKKCITLEPEETSALYVYGNFAVAADEQSFFFYEPEKGRVNAPDNKLNDFYRRTGDVVLGGDGRGKVYLACVEGIFNHSYGGNLMEQIADGKGNHMEDLSAKPRNLAVTADGVVYILYEDGEIYRYFYDETVPAME